MSKESSFIERSTCVNQHRRFVTDQDCKILQKQNPPVHNSWWLQILESPRKSMNFKITFSRLGKSWNLL